MEAVYEKPLILITDKKLRTQQDVVPVMEIALKSSRPLVIIADDIEAHALSLLLVNRVKGGMPVIAIRAPGFGERRGELLKDLAILTSAELITESSALTLAEVRISHLGTCDKITVNKDETLIMGPNINQEMFNDRVNEIKGLLSDPANGLYVTEKLNERLANLTGKIAVLHVGAATETELKEKKDRIDDALRATKSAIAKGYVPGGGDTLLKLSFTLGLDSEQASNIEKSFGAALVAPYELILKNANLACPDLTIFKVGPLNLNGLTGELVNLEEAGIIDPTLVITEALSNAVSAANMILLAEVTVHDTQAKFDPYAGTDVQPQY